MKTSTLCALHTDKQAEIESSKNAILTEIAESVRNTQTQSAQSIASLLEEYKEKPLTQSDIANIKSAAKTEWEKAADQRVYLQKSLDYYAKLIQTVANGANLNTFTESALIEFMHSYLLSFCDILAYQSDCEKAQYQSELEHSRLVYERELDTILAQTKEIAVSGNREWNKAVAELEKKYTEFQNTFITRYNMQTAQWQNALDGFESDKADWIDQMFSEAAARSIVSLTEGGAVKASTASLEEARQKVRTLEKFSKDDFDAGQMVDTILNQTKIAQVNTLLNKRAESIEDVTKPAYALKGSTDYSLLELSERVQKIFDETRTIAENVSSRAASQQFAIEAEARRKETFAKIEAKNRETERGFDDRAYNEGYKKSNGAYTKTITKDVSVFSTQTEKVKVRLWKDFKADEPELDLSILYEQIDSNEFSVIMTLVSAQLTDWENSIFGVSGVASTGDDKASTKTVSYIVGEFEKYAYGENYRGEVELGKGLVGAILLDFEKNSQKEKAGWEALDAPTWERKLWCSDTFPGPSIREFSTMVASIAATVCTFGAGAVLAVAVSAAIMATNELAFELADVGVGYHDWDEAAKNVAKAAVSGALTGASGAAMGAASKVGGIGGVFLKTGITSSSSITTQFTNAFIDGGFSGVKDAFNSWSDWQGIAFSTAGSFVTNGLGAMNSFDSTGKLLNGNTFNTSAMSSFNSLAGGLTTNALEFAFTGQTTFNLANLSMLGLEYGSMWGAAGTGTISGGFFSMTVGQNGTHFAISSAGTDISLGTLKLAAAGAKESSKVIDWKYGSVETNSTLNSINMLGYTNIGGNQALAKDIWNETINVNYTDTGGDYGNYSGGNTINISSTLLGGGAEDYAKLATVLAHEGTHAYGNRIEGEAHKTGLDTYTQINQIYDLSGDSAFVSEMIDAIMDKNSWKENTGDTDHWTIAKKDDGTYGWKEDGRLDFYLEDGTKIDAAFLNDYLNGEDYITSTENVEGRDKLIQKLKESGYSMDEIKKFLEGTSGFANASVVASTLIGGDLSQHNIDELFNSLYKAQESGLLVKNPYNTNSSELNGDGIIESPYLPLTGIVYDTCDHGIRFVTEDFYNALRPQDRENFPLMGFAKNVHLHTDLVSYDSADVVTSVDGAVGLTYSDTWGLSGINYSSESNLAFMSNHLAASSIMQFLNAFGMEGTSLQSTGNNSFVLSGLKAGTTYATMGNTGISAGNHVDFGIYQVNKPYELNMYSDTRLTFKDVYNPNTYSYKPNDKWAQNYSGLTSRSLLDSSNSTVRDTYLRYYWHKYNTDMNYWKKVNGWY